MQRPRRTATVLALTAAFALVAAACGADPDDPVAAEPDAVEEPEAAEEPEEADEPEATEEEPAAAVELAIARTDLGDHLVDGDGMTLYLFTQDPPGESVCADDCADAWPPLVADGDVGAGAGVDDGLIGSITRDDGTEQVTYADQPLYYFAADGAAGDVEGQGLNDVWFVVAADGSAIDGGEEEAADDGGGMGY